MMCAAILTACNEAPTQSILTMTVERQDFQVSVPAEGRLEASQSTFVSVPSSLRGPQSLAWILPNYTQVKAGDVVAKLDPSRESFYLIREQFDFDKLDVDRQLRSEQDSTQALNLGLDRQLSEQELDLAERFFSEDERVYTKIDIIDLMRNKDYLHAQQSYLDWGLSQHSKQANAEQSLLQLKQKGYQAKMGRYRANLQNMEIIAPHDGIFVHARTWNDQLPQVGDMVWSGMALGQLPDTRVMQAKVYVLESEAAGLGLGQRAQVTLDAYGDRSFSGTVSQMDSLAKPKERNSPVNYFELTISLDNTDEEIMLPGRALIASIEQVDLAQTIAIPNQAIFQRDGVSWVYKQQQDQFIKQEIVTGLRSLNRTQIVDGLVAGDVIALSQVAGSH
ncbi:efflux RND transporter periplasmic adaptor subunit [Shewanella sp. NIFS-20-20]|nr:efflux RND transporter periplasmic adaptor subunit [Shewanella sp. NIFS-20-20]